ncbi:hypothetical protein [Sphingopyxis bauzanensis]|uniref:hypothetical protein n=1 Tax=Sphingopyxis bauzanensis TaxID=651663 RepID=UPI001303530A|nr:hypothetical protein GCM10011393_14690 [Sphingopyxis bauzanensis]
MVVTAKSPWTSQPSAGDRGDIAAGGVGAIDIGGEEARARRRALHRPAPDEQRGDRGAVAARRGRALREAALFDPALDRWKAEITARLAEASQDVPDIYPGIAAIYKRKVERLTESLADPETRLDASSDIRSLIGRIVQHPGAKRGEIHATLHGSLMGILNFANDNPSPDASRVITSSASGSRRDQC